MRSKSRSPVGLVVLVCMMTFTFAACGRHPAPKSRSASGTASGAASAIGSDAAATNRPSRAGTTGGTGSASATPAGQGPASRGEPATYLNARYGFSLRIPAGLTAKPYSGPWSVETYTGYGGREGTPVVSIPVFAVNHGGVATGQPYPLFFSAAVHVGVSTDTAACYQASSSGRRGLLVHDEEIGGVTFKAVPVQDAGMMKYLKAVSYRVIHDGRCFAVEQIARGSSYRDSSMRPGLTQAQLDAYYEAAAAIVHSFRFTSSPTGSPATGRTGQLP